MFRRHGSLKTRGEIPFFFSFLFFSLVCSWAWSSWGRVRAGSRWVAKQWDFYRFFFFFVFIFLPSCFPSFLTSCLLVLLVGVRSWPGNKYIVGDSGTSTRGDGPDQESCLLLGPTPPQALPPRNDGRREGERDGSGGRRRKERRGREKGKKEKKNSDGKLSSRAVASSSRFASVLLFIIVNFHTLLACLLASFF